MKKTVIGILAHVDSGKTTLSESILYETGAIRQPGRVDHGSSHLDTNRIERDRGITIFTSQAVFNRGDTQFTLLDTPGHIDFSPEAERTMRVLDCAVLVISGSDGVQSHTRTLWQLLASYSIPVFLFINKMDISQRSANTLMAEIKARFGDGCVDFMQAEESGDTFREELALTDETLMESFADGSTYRRSDIQAAIKKRALFPCYFGSALKNDGITRFLDGLAAYMPVPEYGTKFGARVFKISQDTQGERLTHLKITGGTIKVKQMLSGKNPDGSEWSEKINSLRIYSGDRFETADEVLAGGVCALTGLSRTYPGQGLGFERDSSTAQLEPVLSYRVFPPDGMDEHTLLPILRKLNDEEPELRVSWNEALGEIYLSVMGEIQLEVLTRLIHERYGIDVTFGEGSIQYRETVTEPTLGIGHYEPLRHYAEVQLLIEPAARASGVRIVSEVDTDSLELNWQRQILSVLREQLPCGVLTGSPLTDVKITLLAGRASIKHTDGGDFRQAALRAVRQGLRNTACQLLEPWVDFRIELPSDCIGRTMNDLTRMGGSFNPPETTGELSFLTGSAPVVSLRAYGRELSGYTRGFGKLSYLFCGYRPCANSEEVVARFGYDPDRDSEHPADSVFCANGAGFVVKWDKVPEYKHIDCGVELGAPDKAEAAERAERYIRTVAGDAELMQIFERTYGPIKRQRFAEPTRVHSESAVRKSKDPPIKAKIISTGREYLLIDGYNIIFAWDELRALADKSLDLAREELISRMCNYRGFRDCEVIVVFDAYKVKNNIGGAEKAHNITVVYTKEAETADTYIEKAAYELSKSHRVRVATSDAQEQLIILGSGAIRVSALAFHAEVCAIEKEIRDYLKT